MSRSEAKTHRQDDPALNDPVSTLTNTSSSYAPWDKRRVSLTLMTRDSGTAFGP